MAEYVQPYAEALQQRMVPFPEPNVSTYGTHEDNASGAGSEDEYVSDGDSWISPWESGDMIGSRKVRPGYKLPLADGSRMISLSFDLPRLVGYSMVGDEVFVSALPSGTLIAEALLDAASNAMGVEADTLTLLCQGAPLEPGESLEDLESVAIRQKLDAGPAVYVCEQRSNREVDTNFGGSCHVEVNRLFLPRPGVATIQAVQETKEFVTRHCVDCWLIYTKREVLMYQRPREERRDHDLLIPRGFFPPAPKWPLPPHACRYGHLSDVWSVSLEMPWVKDLLDAHADLTDDRPIPRYQMIVDPNQFVRPTAHGPVWVPCEFDIDSEGRAHIVGGSRCHKYPTLTEQVATPILEAALPLLAQLRRPQLLLDRRRLQVVFKAQRISLPPKVDEHEPEYIGMWHVDGHREDVAAVVLYYYHVDPALVGGDMELCGREPFDVLASADAGDNSYFFDAGHLKEALSGQKQCLPHCRVKISTGTLLVFSNHQMVHRVLKMINKGKSEASRDFVALFILNPASEALVPARCALARPYMLSRTLKAKHTLTPDNLQAILSMAGFMPADDEAKRLRNALLQEQLKPTGQFVSRSNVYATGNGCLTMVGWLEHMLNERDDELFSSWCSGWPQFRALNRPPEKQGRGMSEVFSVATEELEHRNAAG